MYVALMRSTDLFLGPKHISDLLVQYEASRPDPPGSLDTDLLTVPRIRTQKGAELLLSVEQAPQTVRSLKQGLKILLLEIRF